MSASGKSRNRRGEFFRGYFGTGGNGPYHAEGVRAREEHDRIQARSRDQGEPAGTEEPAGQEAEG